MWVTGEGPGVHAHQREHNDCEQGHDHEPPPRAFVRHQLVPVRKVHARIIGLPTGFLNGGVFTRSGGYHNCWSNCCAPCSHDGGVTILRLGLLDGTAGRSLLAGFAEEIATLYPGWTAETGPSATAEELSPPGRALPRRRRR